MMEMSLLQESVNWADATFQSFCLVGIAELFDKTWFVALLMALRYDKVVVFWGCFLALAAHTAIAAIFGYGISQALPVSALHFAAAALYAFFTCLYLKDWYEADPDGDVIAAGKEEAGEAIEEDEEQPLTDKKVQKPQQKLMKIFGTCFMAMFIAEWG